MWIEGGKMIYKTVHEEQTCSCGHVHDHTKEVFDVDAYWVLDHQGNEDPEGTNLYPKVAWTLATAKTKRRQEWEAQMERHSLPGRKRKRTKQGERT